MLSWYIMTVHINLKTHKELFSVNCTVMVKHAHKYCIINGKNYYCSHRSLRQSSFPLNLSLMSPDTSDEYGQAISLRKPLISSWKLSISFTPMEINAQLMAFYRNIKPQPNFFYHTLVLQISTAQRLTTYHPNNIFHKNVPHTSRHAF